ncbi:MAG: hypothetical protein CMH49_06300 [Myxococcales bacterium]|nr:hypothetical protein [Myxococcales bacterium]
MSTSNQSISSSSIRQARPVKILDPILANQIAAGEVVERPASAIKELLENALDAGSSELTIEIREGGRTLMRVSDNGHGMSKDDALLALERHATSKIHVVDDLNEISTLGFRGEALPSIASVSRFQLLTRNQESKTATLISVEGGQTPQISEGAGRVGTEVRVEDLFFNVPARRKFLKSPQTESGIIHEGVQRLALAYPHVAFRFIKDDHISLDLPSHHSLIDRIRALFGARVADHLCPVAWSGPIRLTGFVSHPSFHFSAHRHAYTFINGRFVKDRLFLGAIQRAFGQKLPRGRYPFYLLNLDIHPSLVDVNVHPAKTQVRFVNEEALLDVLTKACKAAMNDMVFEDKASSWREQVVDQNALSLSQQHLDAQNSSTTKNALSVDARSSAVSSGQVSSHDRNNSHTETEVNEALEAHRARIQARLRQHLHGEDISLETSAHSRTKQKSPAAPSKGNNPRKSDLKREQNVSGRHDVERVSQADLEAWRSGAQNSSHELQHSIKSDDPSSSLNPISNSQIIPIKTNNTDSDSDRKFPLDAVKFPQQKSKEFEYRPKLPSLQELHEPKARQALRSVGRADEWWIQEASDGLLMVHLPTARIHALTDQPEAYTLSQAVQFALNPQEEKELDAKTDALLSLGIHLSPFGGQIYRLVSVPKGLESEASERLSRLIHDTLSYRHEKVEVAWAKSLLTLPLSSEARSFTLHWLENGGAADPQLPPFNLMMTYQDMVKRCEHLHPF